MKAPSTVVPQISAPSQKRQIGADRKAPRHSWPSVSRLAETPPCIHGSHTFRKSRGAQTAMKSRLAVSFPKRLHRIADPSDSTGAVELSQLGEVQRIARRAGADLIFQAVAADDEAEGRARGLGLIAGRAGLDHAEHRPRPGPLEHRCWIALDRGRYGGAQGSSGPLHRDRPGRGRQLW